MISGLLHYFKQSVVGQQSSKGAGNTTQPSVKKSGSSVSASGADKPLFLILKKEFFDAIASGEKTVEYRDYTPYWRNRLGRKSFSSVLFQLGYEKNAPRLSAQIVEIRVTDCYEIVFTDVKKIPVQSGSKEDHIKES
jgi:ASC-1-like (ASCH) protein